ncbi:hypothetical protein ROA7023_03799 [Roseisalinus antarcticus]|uniref:Uncharacterized protein n=1 Tax=Roseisalinus antarcticus TaxID=254357 RepID=A0A1Y5TYU6_9RHOB|nr:hypothetical protein ROA7023_03799 [Roseisalinus antarcticus]
MRQTAPLIHRELGQGQGAVTGCGDSTVEGFPDKAADFDSHLPGDADNFEECADGSPEVVRAIARRQRFTDLACNARPGEVRR